MKNESKGYLQLIIFSLTGGLVGVIAKMIQGFSVYSIVFLRAVIGFSFIFFVALFNKRIRELKLIQPPKTFMIGLFETLSVILYFLAVMKTSVSNAIFLVYTAPIFSVIMAKLFLKENIEKRTIIGMFIVILGTIFIIDPRKFSFQANETIGNLMGLASGIFYAAMATVAKPITKKVSSYYTTFWTYSVMAILTLFFFEFNSYGMILQNWWQLLVLGVLCSGVAFILFSEGIKKVKGQKVFIIMSLEPFAATLFAAILLKEIPSLLTILGGILILYGIRHVTRKNDE